MNKKPLPTIGVDKYTFFKVNEDSVSGTEYGEAYNLKERLKLHRPTAAAVMFLMRTTVRMRRQAISKNWDTILQMPIFRRRLTQCGVD